MAMALIHGGRRKRGLALPLWDLLLGDPAAARLVLEHSGVLWVSVTPSYS
jgi:hypothetical protein